MPDDASALSLVQPCDYSNHMQKTVGARELKTRLGKYLRAVRNGATIVVTERGDPIAEIRPLESTGDRDEARRNKLAALGLLTKGSGLPLGRFTAVGVRGRPVRRTLIEAREDRF